MVSAAAFSASTVLKISFDNFDNPPSNPLILQPINLRINYADRSTSDHTLFKTRTSYFPNIFVSDSVNVGVPGVLPGTMIRSANERGASTTLHYWAVTWPYTSNSGDVSQKIAFKLQGGITCCQSFTTLWFSDATVYYDRLWVNTAANISVYRMPTRNSGNGVNFHINSVNNPQEADR